MNPRREDGLSALKLTDQVSKHGTLDWQNSMMMASHHPFTMQKRRAGMVLATPYNHVATRKLNSRRTLHLNSQWGADHHCALCFCHAWQYPRRLFFFGTETWPLNSIPNLALDQLTQTSAARPISARARQANPRSKGRFQ